MCGTLTLECLMLLTVQRLMYLPEEMVSMVILPSPIMWATRYLTLRRIIIPESATASREILPSTLSPLPGLHCAVLLVLMSVISGVQVMVTDMPMWGRIMYSSPQGVTRYGTTVIYLYP